MGRGVDFRLGDSGRHALERLGVKDDSESRLKPSSSPTATARIFPANCPNHPRVTDTVEDAGRLAKHRSR